MAGRQSPVSQARRTAAERPLQWDEFEKFFKNRRLGFGDVHEKCFGILRSQEPSRGSEEFLVRSDFILLIEGGIAKFLLCILLLVPIFLDIFV